MGLVIGIAVFIVTNDFLLAVVAGVVAHLILDD